MNKGTSTAPLADQLIPPGVIWEWAGDTLPDPAVYGRWAWADGSAVSRAEYPRLFGNIGVRHGAGNGTTTFNLPDRGGRVGVGQKAGDSDFAVVGQVGGLKTSTAAHTHTMNNHDHSLNSHAHTITHAHNTNPHDHHLNGHGHTVNNHSHGGGTGFHAHNNANGTVFTTFNGTHSHNSGGGQASEGAWGGSWGTNISTNSVGQANTGESPGTDGNWGLTSGVWNNTQNGGSLTANTGNSSGNTGTANGASGASSAGATNGNLQPYIALGYIVKV